jgi:hypothetical protein
LNNKAKRQKYDKFVLDIGHLEPSTSRAVSPSNENIQLNENVNHSPLAGLNPNPSFEFDDRIPLSDRSPLATLANTALNDHHIPPLINTTGSGFNDTPPLINTTGSPPLITNTTPISDHLPLANSTTELNPNGHGSSGFDNHQTPTLTNTTGLNQGSISGAGMF